MLHDPLTLAHVHHFACQCAPHRTVHIRIEFSFSRWPPLHDRRHFIFLFLTLLPVSFGTAEPLQWCNFLMNFRFFRSEQQRVNCLHNTSDAVSNNHESWSTTNLHASNERNGTFILKSNSRCKWIYRPICGLTVAISWTKIDLFARFIQSHAIWLRCMLHESSV